LFDEWMGTGMAEVIDPGKPSVWISDFPIARRTDLWAALPQTMHFQPEEFHPLPEAIAFEYML
jgi:hypothetical protein